MTVGIIGTGKVAWNLAYSFQKTDKLNLKFVYGRSPEKVERFKDHFGVKAIRDLHNIDSNCDILILAITDSSIHTVSEAIEHFSGIIVHTSGAQSSSLLKKHKKFGIFYPLYSFYDNGPTDFDKIPILITSPIKEVSKILLECAKTITPKATVITDEQRLQLHISAVFVNNFSNFIMTLGLDIIEENNLPIDVLQPIIVQSCENWVKGKSKASQSGPAIRRDTRTIDKHIANIKDEQSKEIYKLLTEKIQQYYS